MIRSLMRASVLSLLSLCLCLPIQAALAESAAATAAPAMAEPVILVLGDSLGAAFGVPKEQGWTALLQARLQAQGYRHRVVNASISGDTTSGGLARLPALLKRHRPKMVLLELGGNDGLRGLPLERMRSNLTRMTRLAQDAGSAAVLFEMYIPTNYGQDYANGFTRSFADVARDTGAALVPFWLEAIATDPDAFQDDGLHPDADAQPIMLDAVWPTLEALLDQGL
jgi:acyl-CoA thioesterase-1